MNCNCTSIKTIKITSATTTSISFYIAIENLKENEEQSRLLQEHLKHQDDKYLKKSIEQNEIIIEQNEEIIKLLKGWKYES